MSKTAAAKAPEQEIEVDIITLTSETLLGDLLKAVFDEIKAQPDVWQKLPARQQEDSIDRITRRLSGLLQSAVEMIASKNHPTIMATLESVQFKDGIKAVVTCSQNNPARHDLADAAGGLVMIVVADAEPYLGGTENVKAEADQKSWLDSPVGTPAPKA